MSQFLNVTALLLSFTYLTIADIVPRPRGVSIRNASLYNPNNNQKWVCLDGSRSIQFIQINDDYCDCSDGSDEPGTSACPLGYFHCENVGHRPEEIPTSRVNDGICDCCDASDEYATNSGNCRNRCQELGRIEQELRKNEEELYKLGAVKRMEMIVKGRQMRLDREKRRAELEYHRLEKEAIRAEKDEIKRNAEAAEAEALEIYKDQNSEHNVGTSENGRAYNKPQNSREESQNNFIRYDTNKDGFVEITELQVDMILDRDRNGVVTVEEAKYFLDERERVDCDTFTMISWPRIKTAQMMAQHIFKPPSKLHGDETEESIEANSNSDGQGIHQGELDIDEDQNYDDTGAGSVTEVTTSTPEYNSDSKNIVEQSNAARNAYEKVEHAFQETENEMKENVKLKSNYEEQEESHSELDIDEDQYDEDEDLGDGSVTEVTTPAPEYDSETKNLIELANAARTAYEKVDQEIREIENEVKEIDENNSKDYGINEEWATMAGECYKFEDREYVYTLCPFDRASQKQRSGGSETTLGRWDRWISEDNNKYAKQQYLHGASCWNGPQRSVIVKVKCALEHAIIAVTEPNRCEYFFDFQTPAACYVNNLSLEDESLHDEL